MEYVQCQQPHTQPHTGGCKLETVQTLYWYGWRIFLVSWCLVPSWKEWLGGLQDLRSQAGWKWIEWYHQGWCPGFTSTFLQPTDGWVVLWSGSSLQTCSPRVTLPGIHDSRWHSAKAHGNTPASPPLQGDSPWKGCLSLPHTHTHSEQVIHVHTCMYIKTYRVKWHVLQTDFSWHPTAGHTQKGEKKEEISFLLPSGTQLLKHVVECGWVNQNHQTTHCATQKQPLHTLILSTSTHNTLMDVFKLPLSK